MTNKTDSIYLEPGSVWRRGDEWRMFRRTFKVLAEYATFGGSMVFYRDISVWLSWAKHPDTVLVYSPSGNKLPVKEGWVRKRIAVLIDTEGDIADGYGNTFAKEHWSNGHRRFIEFDLKLPTPTEPEIVEGSVSE